MDSLWMFLKYVYQLKSDKFVLFEILLTDREFSVEDQRREAYVFCSIKI